MTQASAIAALAPAPERPYRFRVDTGDAWFMTGTAAVWLAANGLAAENVYAVEIDLADRRITASQYLRNDQGRILLLAEEMPATEDVVVPMLVPPPLGAIFAANREAWLRHYQRDAERRQRWSRLQQHEAMLSQHNAELLA